VFNAAGQQIRLVLLSALSLADRPPIFVDQ